MQIVVMPAWMAGTQVRKDASGDIHVNLDSSTPCCNDYYNRGVLLKVTEAPPPLFSKEDTKSTKFIMIKISEPFVAFVIFVVRIFFVKCCASAVSH